jgi:hypothetical protein
VVDGVDDRGGLFDVGDGARRRRLDDEEPRLAAEACDPVAVRGRPGGERGDERPVPRRV